MKNKLFVFLLTASSILSAGTIEEDINEKDVLSLRMHQYDITRAIQESTDSEEIKILKSSNKIINKIVKKIAGMPTGVKDTSIEELLERYKRNEQEIAQRKHEQQDPFGWFGPFTPETPFPPAPNRYGHQSFLLLPPQQQSYSNWIGNPYPGGALSSTQTPSNLHSLSFVGADSYAPNPYPQSYTPQFLSGDVTPDSHRQSNASLLPSSGEEVYLSPPSMPITFTTTHDSPAIRSQKAIEYLRRLGAQEDELYNAMNLYGYGYQNRFPQGQFETADIAELKRAFRNYINSQGATRATALIALKNKYSPEPAEQYVTLTQQADDEVVITSRPTTSLFGSFKISQKRKRDATTPPTQDKKKVSNSTTSLFSSFKISQKPKRDEKASDQDNEEETSNQKNKRARIEPITDRHMTIEYLKKLGATPKEIKSSLGSGNSPSIEIALKATRHNVLKISYENYISDLAASQSPQDQEMLRKLLALVTEKTNRLKELL